MPQHEPVVAMPFALETAMQLLAAWPRVYDTFQRRMSTELRRGVSPAVLLMENGAGFGAIE